MKKSHSIGVFCATMFLVMGEVAQAATVTLLEQEFPPADLSTIVISGPAGGQTATRPTIGGNSGTSPNDPYLEVTTNTNVTTFTGFSLSGLTYDFSAGSIDQLDFSVDYEIQSAFGQGHGFGLLAIQNGDIFRATSNATGSTASGWQSVLKTGITSFTQDTGSGGIDFSAGANPITFGLYTANTGGNTIRIGYDNLMVELSTSAVPIPAAIWLFGSGLLGLIGLNGFSPRFPVLGYS